MHKGLITKRLLFPALLAMTVSGLERPGWSGDIREAGRDLLAKYGKAIVTIRVTSKQTMSMGGDSHAREKQSEIKGTVISAAGLTVAALSSLDPSSKLRSMMGGKLGGDMNFESQVQDLKLVVDKTTEVPAEVILRDPDLDLVLLKPKEKQAEAMSFIDFGNSVVPKLLEQCVLLARLDAIGDYELGLMTGEIQAIVEKPRTFYIQSGELHSGGTGLPVFNGEGKVVGLVQTKSSGPLASLGIVRPAVDVVEFLKQYSEED